MYVKEYNKMRRENVGFGPDPTAGREKSVCVRSTQGL